MAVESSGLSCHPLDIGHCQRATRCDAEGRRHVRLFVDFVFKKRETPVKINLWCVRLLHHPQQNRGTLSVDSEVPHQ